MSYLRLLIREHDLHRPSLSHQPRQAHGAPVEERNSPAPAIHAEIGGLFHHADVAPQGKLHPARDRRARELGVELIVHVNAEGVAQGVSPINSGSAIHTRVMKTEALKQVLASDLHLNQVEIDEFWSFVQKKRAQLPSRTKESAGAAWSKTATVASSLQVLPAP